MFLETERLIIREHETSDAENLYQMMSSPIVMQYLDLPHSSITQSLDYITWFKNESTSHNRRHWNLAIIKKESGAYVGKVHLSVETDYIVDGRADISYALRTEYWGKGFASESATRMIDYAFDILRLHKITAGCLKINVASEHVMAKCGMVKEAEYREHALIDDTWVNRIEYGMLARDRQQYS